MAISCEILKEVFLPEFIDVKEVSKMAGVGTGAIYAGVKAGTIPHRRVNGRILFVRKKIKEWLKNCEVDGVDTVVNGDG